MNFQTLKELIQAIDKNQNYSHQIKGKRLKKQLKSISQLQFQHIQFKKFEITDVGIYLHINVKSDEKQQTDILLRLDHEYPFNPPQIFYTNQTKPTEYGYCKDLLPTILKNQIWGPSLTLPIFIQKLPNLVQSLKKGDKILWTYHNQFEYGFDQLKKLGVKLYNLQQYTWQYKVIKIKKAKIIGFTPDHLLKFQKCLDNQKILKLQLWLPIKQITQVQVKTGKKNYQLQINYTVSDNKFQNKIQKIYLGGQPTYLQIILDNLNSIQMIERKVKNFQKFGIKDYDYAIKCYTTLIEYYSLTNKQLTDKYMNLMKKLIESQYSQDKNNKQKMIQIQT